MLLGSSPGLPERLSSWDQRRASCLVWLLKIDDGHLRGAGLQAGLSPCRAVLAALSKSTGLACVWVEVSPSQRDRGLSPSQPLVQAMVLGSASGGKQGPRMAASSVVTRRAVHPMPAGRGGLDGDLSFIPPNTPWCGCAKMPTAIEEETEGPRG